MLASQLASPCLLKVKLVFNGKAQSLRSGAEVKKTPRKRLTAGPTASFAGLVVMLARWVMPVPRRAGAERILASPLSSADMLQRLSESNANV